MNTSWISRRIMPSALKIHTREQSGFTIVELLVSIAVGLLLIAGLTTIFVNSSRSRDEVDKTNQQIESGRYAMQVLIDEFRLTGFWAGFDLAQAGLTTPSSKPDPCATDITTLTTALPLHIQGYDNGATLSCLSDVKDNTDIVVVRHASTCVSGSTNCAYVSGAAYFQASLCNSSSELGSASVSDQYRLDTTVANLNRTNKDCSTLADMRQYVTRIYFIANNDVSGDGIPTLKRAELGAGSFSIVPIAEGIENLQLEYGIDTNSDGVPDVYTANPDTYNSCSGAGCMTNWVNTMSVKVNMLARNTTVSSNYTDTKTYYLGLKSDGTNNSVGPFSDYYKRHVYPAEVRLNNPAGRRE